jgi:hypothetical protein
LTTSVIDTGGKFATGVNCRMPHNSMNAKKVTPVTAETPTSEGTPTSDFNNKRDTKTLLFKHN